jgi:hypothetical protein
MLVFSIFEYSYNNLFIYLFFNLKTVFVVLGFRHLRYTKGCNPVETVDWYKLGSRVI